MPKMTGLEAAKIIHQRFPEIRIIMTTARMPDGPAQAKDAGAVAVLVKPCTSEDLFLLFEVFCGLSRFDTPS